MGDEGSTKVYPLLTRQSEIKDQTPKERREGKFKNNFRKKGFLSNYSKPLNSKLSDGRHIKEVSSFSDS